MTSANPLLQSWDTPYGLPPFEAVRAEHFEPAFAEAIAAHRAEIDAIGDAAAAPTFDNTVAAFDGSGRALERISALFHNLASSETSPALQAVQVRIAPVLAAHRSAVWTHRGLWTRIDALHAQRDALALSAEQRRALERYHLDFVRAGARFAPAAQVRYAQIMARLAELTTRFGQNVLADENAFQLALRGEADAAGLPEFVRATLRQAARDRGADAGGETLLVTLARAHVLPFLTHAARRDLREQVWRAWTSRGAHDGAHDNRAIAREILALRCEQAQLHGYASYADYALADTMAGRPSAVLDLLHRVWEPARRRAADEEADLRGLAAARGASGPIAPWDWLYYAEQVRQARYDIDDAAIKPYFALDSMVEAIFDCARRLFGVRFVAQPQVRAYHPDVRVYEVRTADEGDALIGVFLHDNHARPSKRSGAWMSAYRVQSRNGDVRLPIVVNNNNFAQAPPGEPVLLGLEEARTLFHEFGHALHGLLSDVTYARLSGTAVLRDFVELPSQLFEHWLDEPEVLKRHARHVRTGAPMPDELIARLKRARTFNQGYETVRYTASALVDMAAHALTDPASAPDIVEFERAQLERLGAPASAGMNHRLAHFQHLFAGSGYAAGYYAYLWAEVLDADGYEAFREAGDPFDAALAARLRRYVYASGNSIEPGAAFRAFRGRDATVAAMLEGRGLTPGLATT